MRGDWAWETLGIAPTSDVGEIRRAYAARLKEIDTETDAGAFIALRHARDEAFGHAAGEADRPLDFELGDWEPDFQAAPVRDVPDALPAISAERLDRIDALLFSGAEPEDEHELERLTRAVLDESPEHIESARWLETWVADRIVQAMPRSDPMIDPAIDHYRWDQGSELSRDPEIDYILQRRDDRVFEIDLATNGGEYSLVLESLRAPPGDVPGRKAGWMEPRVEYLLSYLQTYRPTVLRGLDDETVRAWYRRIGEEGESGGLGGWLRGRRRNRVWNRGIHGVETGARETASLAGGGWIAFMLVIAAIRLLSWSAAPDPPPSFVNAPPPPILYQDAARDLNPFISRATSGQGDIVAVEANNSWLHGQLMETWRQGRREGRDRAWLDQRVTNVLDEGVSDALRGGGYELQSEHWRLFADQLKWARRSSPELCAAYLRGASPGPMFAPDLNRRFKALVARALLEPSGRPPERRSVGSAFAVPGAVAEAARAKARLDPKSFAEALMDRGTAARRCDARIALIEAALDQPKAVAAPLLRRMSGTL